MDQAGSRQLDAYRRLAEINRAITTSLNFDRLLDLIVENAAQLVEARASALLLLDRDGLLRIRSARGLPDDAVETFAGRMEEDVVKKLYKEFGRPAESLITVPVLTKQSLDGLLLIIRDQPLDEEENWQLSALADQAAIALRNSRLYEMELAEASRERNETLEALRESNERINTILESITDIFYSLDQEWRFVDFNRKAETKFGKPREELLGKVIWEVYPQMAESEMYHRFHQAVSEMQPAHFEMASALAPGAWFEFHAYPSGTGLTVYLRDITERREAEQERARLLEAEREARAEAEKANQLKDEFLATLSHELRNPLNVILGYSEVLLRSKEAQNSEFIRQTATILRRNALAQSQLVRDLLDLSRLRTGKVSLNREAVSLITIINNAIETVRAEAQEKKIEIRANVPDEVLFAEADPLRLEQIVWNLLNNAVKFTPAGGLITISLARENKHAILTVADTGQGISPEFLPHVFEMFRQADATSSRTHAGLGIGLALVKQLVELHRGRIEVKSEGTGQGAEFTIHLPLSHEKEQSQRPPRDAARGLLNTLKVLVVDDSADTTDMLRGLLELEGARVATACRGAEALRIVGKESFDVIISDISMPEMDGFEFLRRLRVMPGKDQTPVLAITGFGRAEDVERAQAEGFLTHITKPIDVGRLIDVLERLAHDPATKDAKKVV